MGYTPREAGFLELVALQSGYFLRRQYNQFLNRKRGGTAAALICKLLQKGHVSVEPSCTRTPIYRLRRRAFYERIGEPNNRHRRRRGTVGIASKVMALDAILEMRDVAWLGTEAEKRGFFEQGLSILSLFLPHRRAGGTKKAFRYFADKSPIGFEPDAPSEPPRPSFVDADPGSSAIGFETFLARHKLLFACLVRFQVVYASPFERRFAFVREIFEASHRLEIIESRVNRFGRYFDLMRKLPRDQQGEVPKWALAERSRLQREIDPEDLLQFLKLAAQPSRPDMRNLVGPKVSFERCKGPIRAVTPGPRLQSFRPSGVADAHAHPVAAVGCWVGFGFTCLVRQDAETPAVARGPAFRLWRTAGPQDGAGATPGFRALVRPNPSRLRLGSLPPNLRNASAG